MPHQEIPSAFLIRALARRESEHCDRCGHRMFVKGVSGLCPFCRADRPALPLVQTHGPVPADEPFAPTLREAAGWERIPLGRRLREMTARSRRSSKPVPTPG